VTRSEFNARQLTLESRILNASYHAMQGGRFERTWRKLQDHTIELLQALIDDERENDATMRHVRQTDGYQKYGAFGVYGRSR
jgi:hypothetical protein